MKIPKELPSEQIPEFMTAYEAAGILKITAQAVRNLCRRGRLQHRKMGDQYVISGSALLELILDTKYARKTRRKR